MQERLLVRLGVGGADFLHKRGMASELTKQFLAQRPSWLKEWFP